MTESVRIATHSFEEGLDFAFNLLVSPLEEAGREDPRVAAELLTKIANFVHPRYAGEPRIALDAILDLYDAVSENEVRNRIQIELQIAWLKDNFADSG